jgi:SPP1 family predicted phage head-tail adaptor
MRIGKLHHRLTLEAPVETADGGGGAVKNWQLVATLWGQIEPMSGAESSFGEQLEAGGTHRITLRYNPAVSPLNRLRFGARIFDILSVLNLDEKNQWFVCQCHEVITQ